MNHAKNCHGVTHKIANKLEMLISYYFCQRARTDRFTGSENI